MRTKLTLAIAAALALTGLAATPAQAATAPTVVGTAQASSGTSVTVSNSVSTAGILALVWESKEGQNATPVDPTFSATGTYSVLSNNRSVYDDSGSTRGQIGVITAKCTTGTCSNWKLTFTGQTQSHMALTVIQFGTADTISGVTFAGGSQNVSGHQYSASISGGLATGEYAIVGGAHEANETTTPEGQYYVCPSFCTDAFVTAHSLADVYGSGNGSLGVGYLTTADAPADAVGANPIGGSPTWVTSSPGSAFAFKVS